MKTILRTWAILAIFAMLTGFDTPVKKNTSYGPGEFLEYSLNYGFIKGGKGILSVKDTLMNGVKLNHVVARGETVGVADMLFSVRDRYESFINPTNDLPMKSVRSIKEGRYKYYDEVTYNHDSLYVVSKLKGTQPVPSRIQDILSAFYYARNFKFNDSLKKDEIIEIMTYFSNELFPLRIRYRGIETVSTKFGDVQCYRFSPVTEKGRAFATEDDMHVWISRDANRIPVRIQFDLTVGSFNCVLDNYKNLKNPFTSLKK
ncbi:uncharacterized protein DUF3108 [Breznakibacter xylanolyticus]|uniref:Uncharacterized protein DUF3108 n=1 Tax=Breznakibacter xylanolyticus TaxID=990 RepID=A0A2W7NJ71_9BACT|nr:DUF3108 domain-containing protein [Breznakibacter xylanolyticus]MBN2742965.1 DUF3108 domain-containing protein [Marinilabiliaceae bacterium]PZX19483.1 uncharacterized protein DUF3108 [Breznakibacter xylanolyticus]